MALFYMVIIIAKWKQAHLFLTSCCYMSNMNFNQSTKIAGKIFLPKANGD